MNELITIFSYSIVFLAMITTSYGLLNQSQRYVEKFKERNSVRNSMEILCRKVIDDFNKTETSEADSKYDSFWKWNNFYDSEIDAEIKLIPCSGRINLNFTPSNILMSDKFLSIAEVSKSQMEEIVSNRNGGTFITSYDDVKHLIPFGEYEKNFTTIGGINFNLCNPEVFESIVSLLGTNYAQDTMFIKKQNDLFNSKSFIKNYDEFFRQFSFVDGKIIDHINLEPLININFIDENLLENLVAALNLCPVSSIKKLLLKGKEITRKDLELIFHNDFAKNYIGCKSNYFVISIKSKNVELETVVKRNITFDGETSNFQFNSSDDDKPNFRIVTKLWR